MEKPLQNTITVNAKRDLVSRYILYLNGICFSNDARKKRNRVFDLTHLFDQYSVNYWCSVLSFVFDLIALTTLMCALAGFCAADFENAMSAIKKMLLL